LRALRALLRGAIDLDLDALGYDRRARIANDHTVERHAAFYDQAASLGA
jgi:hypothetical protein